MSASLCFTSTLKIEEEEIMVTKKQGIISILGSDDDNNKNNNNIKKASSLRRTLSADMSSKKWLTQNGFNNSSLKKTASSLNLIPVSITEDSPTQFDIWGSIISQKVDEKVESEPALYIHPLVKRSKSSLSEKSLEICTESLGSETGSDGFSSYPASETSEEDEQRQEMETTMKNNSFNYVKMPEKKSFPPPIPSLSLRNEGGPAATLRMKSHRNNGRLVLEAVPVPQQNTNFNAQRKGGRLVLTFAGPNINKQEDDPIAKKYEELEEVFDDFEDDDDDFTDSEIDEETEEMEDRRYVFEAMPKKNLSGGMINVHRLALMMNKPMALPNRNPTIWSNKFNVDQVKPTAIGQSLPPRPPKLIPSQQPSVAAKVAGGGAASLNAYEYYWRPEPMGPQSLATTIYNDDNKKSGAQILRRNKGEYMVPLSKGCKEPRRSLVFWEPCCITTS